MRALPLLPAGVLALLLGACGSDQSHSSSAARPADATLARRILAGEVALVRRSLPGAAERTPSAGTAPTCSTAIAAFTHAGRARSPTFSYRHQLELRTTAYVFATEGDATHALSAYASKASQSCVARSTTASLRRSGYSTASPHFRTATARSIGDQAIASEITIPSRHRGRPFTWHFDATAVRDGRVISVLDTLAGRSTAHYNQRLAAHFSDVAARAE